jgi:hypothetical protein
VMAAFDDLVFFYDDAAPGLLVALARHVCPPQSVT